MIREELLALADELESCGPDCDECPAFEQAECRGYRECTENVSKYCARRIREAVERDGEGATTVSAYDLLSEDEREALALVREHGGLETVEKRLMPEGMEWLLEVWPRWSNGEYCKFGDWWKADKYGEREPQQLSRLVFFTPEHLREWGQDEGENFGYEWDCMRPSDTTYRPDKVEPPAPKVLDADGAEIREGDVLYSVETGDYVIVDSIEPGNPWFAIADGALQHCAKFTHRAPVFAADGRPLRVGETVYEVGGDGTAYVFDGMSEYVDGLAMLHHDSKPYIGTGLRVGQLTHEQPDTWERLEEDARQLDIYLNDTTDDYPRMRCCRDLVRRARALAGVTE